MTQEEHAGRHSPAGACGSPAGSGGAGGLLSGRGPDHDRTVIPRESGGIHMNAVGKFTA